MQHQPDPKPAIDAAATAAAKLAIAENSPWERVEFDPDEADAAGAFAENAVTIEDAADAAMDYAAQIQRDEQEGDKR